MNTQTIEQGVDSKLLTLMGVYYLNEGKTILRESEQNLRRINFRFNFPKEQFLPPKETKGKGIISRLENSFNELQKYSLDDIENQIVNLRNSLNEVYSVVQPSKIKTIERSIARQIHDYIKEIYGHVQRMENLDESIWSELVYKTERISRALSENAPNKFWWFGEKGIEEDLDLLQDIKAKASEEIKPIIIQSQQKIIDRHLKDLLEFFGLNSAEFLQSIENTIAECESVEHPDFKKLFYAKEPSRVIEVYKEIKDILEKSYSSEDVKKWLGVSNKIFERNTPKKYLVRGKVFQVLYFLRKVEGN